MNFENVFIIIPAYNEEKYIGRVISGLFKQGFSRIIVVDDSSVDRTVEEARRAGALVLRHNCNRGQGAALETGNEYARKHGAQYIVHFDADGQFNPEDIITALKAMDGSKKDIVLGSRFLDDRTQMPWFKKRIIFPIGKLINYILTGVQLTDVHNGFRVLSRNALKKIHITQDRMAHASEIIALIKKHELSYVEIPVEVTYHEYGQGVGGGLRILKEWIVHLITK
jgi:glycosyltransferase involved in cell wall biosynthesis